jgi:hypothetical protein
MKLVSSLIACAVLSTSAVAIAAPLLDDTVVTVPASGARYNMTIVQYKQFKGDYTLSNGSVLHLAGYRDNMTAQIDDQPVHRIVSTSSKSFEGVGHRLALNLDITDPYAPTGDLTYVDESQRNVAGLVEPKLVRVAMR